MLRLPAPGSRSIGQGMRGQRRKPHHLRGGGKLGLRHEELFPDRRGSVGLLPNPNHGPGATRGQHGRIFTPSSHGSRRRRTPRRRGRLTTLGMGRRRAVLHTSGGFKSLSVSDGRCHERSRGGGRDHGGHHAQDTHGGLLRRAKARQHPRLTGPRGRRPRWASTPSHCLATTNYERTMNSMIKRIVYIMKEYMPNTCRRFKY
jgi:hypothetical protein